MKLLVIGGAGYIGSHFVYEAIRAGHEITIFDNLSTGNKESIHPQAKFVEGDLTNKKDVDAVLAGDKFDAALHFGAKLIVPESVEKPLMYYENNVYGVGVMLEGLKNHGVKNVMFSSTAAVYGDPINDEPLTEDSSLTIPINPYGASKKAAEDLIQWTHAAHDINYIIFRYFNVAGADSSGEIGLSPKNPPTHLIPVINEAILGIRPEMKIFGEDYPTPDGTCIRDYIHITDLAQAHVLGIEYLVKTGESNIINLGTNTGLSVKEIIEATEEALKVTIPRTIFPRRAGDPAKLTASNKKAKELLGWEPKLTVADMITSDYNWRKNPKFSNR
jgi:UDP-glucose-4-epimerase